MADWAVYPMDRAINTTIVTANQGASSAPRVVDIDQATFWEPGASGSAVKIYGDLSTAYNITALGFGNVRGLAGATLAIYRSTTVPGTLDTLQVSVTLPTPCPKNFVVAFTPSGGTMRYWNVNLPGGTGSTVRIGSISVLDGTAKLAIASPAASTRPSYSVNPGFLVAPLATGAPMTQIQGGPTRMMQLQFENVPSSTGSLFHTFLDSLDDNYGWARGVWITDDTFGASVANFGQGFYGLPQPDAPVIGQTAPGPYGAIALTMALLPLGVE